MAEQTDAVQRVAQLAELFVDEHASTASVAASEETIDRGMVARADPVVRPSVLRIPPLRKARAVDELIGHSLKSGHDDDGGAAVHRIQDNSPDVPDAVGCGERRSAELEHSHL